MLNAFKTQKRFKDDEVVVAWTSFSTEGVPKTIVKGDPLRGNHPAVLKCPEYFVRQGTPPDEWPSEYEAAGVAIARTDGIERAERAKLAPKPIPVDERVVCVRGFITAKGRSYLEGGTYSRNDEAVRDPATRVHFNEPARPLAAQ